MGEIADSIIEGEICQMCCAPDGHGTRGFPFTCAECDGPEYFGEEDDPTYRTPKPTSPKVPCAVCGKLIHEIGMHQHMSAKHPD